MKKYIKPQIETAEADFDLLSVSGPGATDIGAPTLESSVWDEEDTHY